MSTSSTYLLATPFDAQELAQSGACACGHAALAAALCCNVRDVLPAFQSQGPGLWVNAHRMACAITLRTGRHRIVPLEQAWEGGPNVLWIQGLGPWMEEGTPTAARNQRTHWITTIQVEGDNWVYDINHNDYLPKAIWEKHILTPLLTRWKATGWQLRSALTVIA